MFFLCVLRDLRGEKEGLMPKVSLNTPAPDFELADYTGKAVRLSDLRGKNVVLVFNRTFM